jgi:hypothetical protein
VRCRSLLAPVFALGPEHVIVQSACLTDRDALTFSEKLVLNG